MEEFSEYGTSSIFYLLSVMQIYISIICNKNTRAIFLTYAKNLTKLDITTGKEQHVHDTNLILAAIYLFPKARIESEINRVH